VKRFAAKTGDLRSLSLIDIKVLALTYQLEKEKNNGTKHLRSEPAPENSKSIPGVQRVVGRNVKDMECKHYDGETGCRRGDQCPFRHPYDITESEIVADEFVDEIIATAMGMVKATAPKDVLSTPVKAAWGGVKSTSAPSVPVDVSVSGDDGEFPSLAAAMVIPLALAAQEFPALNLPTIHDIRRNLDFDAGESHGDSEDCDEVEELEHEEGEEEEEGEGGEGHEEETPTAIKKPKKIKNNISVADKLKSINEREREERKMREAAEKKRLEEEEAALALMESEGGNVRESMLAANSDSATNNKNTKSRILYAAGDANVVVYDEGEDDSKGWSGPGHISSSAWGLGAIEQNDAVDIKVGCITTDYAMQNILLQVGMKLISLEGRLVSKIKQWVLSCRGCFEIEKDMTKMFCSRCGGPTLEKISFFVDKHGNTRYGYRRDREGAKRGMVYGLPAVKGGRSNDLILREDQLMMGKWRQKAQVKGELQSVFGADITGSLGLKIAASNNLVVGYGNKNPNAQKGRERRGKKRVVKLKNGLKDL
jgi:rRNA maturation endonuclease Nob1